MLESGPTVIWDLTDLGRGLQKTEWERNRTQALRQSEHGLVVQAFDTTRPWTLTLSSVTSPHIIRTNESRQDSRRTRHEARITRLRLNPRSANGRTQWGGSGPVSLFSLILQSCPGAWVEGEEPQHFDYRAMGTRSNEGHVANMANFLKNDASWDTKNTDHQGKSEKSECFCQKTA